MEDAFAWEEEQQEEQASQAAQQPAAAGAAPQHKSHPLLRRGALLTRAVFSLPRRVLIPWQVRVVLPLAPVAGHGLYMHPRDHFVAVRKAWPAIGRLGSMSIAQKQCPAPKHTTLPSPLRHLLQSTGMVLCDYLLPGESVEAAAERVAELVGLELPGSEPGILEVEAAQPAGPPLVPATWNPVAGSGAAGAAAAMVQGKGQVAASTTQGLAAGSDSGAAKAGAGASCAIAAMAAAGASAAVALLAIVVGLMGMGR